MTRTNRVYISCVTCGESFAVKVSEANKGKKFCSMACRSKGYTGSGNPKWRGGRILDGHGRVMLYVPGDPHATMMGGNYAYEYRLTAAAKIGRPLERNEIVHHINGDHSDNRPENLEVMTQSQHVAAHDLPAISSRDRRAKLEAGGRVGCSKLTIDQVRVIKTSPKRNFELADEFGVDRTTISRIRSGHEWSWVNAS